MVLGVDEDTILEQIRRPNLGTSLERAMDNEFNPRFIDYDDTNLNNKAEDLGKDIEDIMPKSLKPFANVKEEPISFGFS